MAPSLSSPNNTGTVTAPTAPALTAAPVPVQVNLYHVDDNNILFILALIMLIITITATIVGLIIYLSRDIPSRESKKVPPLGPVNARRVVALAPAPAPAPNASAVIKGNNCSICLSEFQTDECIRALPECKFTQRFHVSCMDILLKNHNKCTDCHTLTAEPIGKGKAIEEP